MKLKVTAALALIAAAILSYLVVHPPGRSPNTDQAARAIPESSLRDRGASLPHGLDERVEVGLPAESVQQVHLRPGRVITGFVADAETAERIPDATVRLGDRVVATDAEGAYRIPGVADGEHEIIASAAGYAKRNAVLRVNVEDARGDILLDPAIEVLVTVIDEDRKPIDGARIRGDGITEGFLVDLATTGPHGTAALPGISRLRLPTLLADKRGYVFARREEFQVEPKDGTGALTIVLRAVARIERAITGRVTDPKRRPIPGVTIHWVPTFGPQGPRDATVTGADGRFTLRFEDEQETCKVGVHGEGWSPVILLEVRCGTPEEPAVLDFQLERAHWLEGTVVDEKGQPVQGITVLAMPCGETLREEGAFPGVAKRAISANGGSFRLDGISGPTVAVKIRGEGWSPWSRERVEVDRRAAFTIKSMGSIRGRVVDAETGEPVPVFTVKLIGGGGYAVHRREPGESFTSSDGGFVLRDLHRENPFDLKVEAQDRSPAVLRDVQALPEGEADELLVELYRLGGLEGVAFDAATSEPVRGARVAVALWEGKDFFWAFRERLERFRETVTGEDGTFRLEEGEPDWLLVHADGYSRLLVAPAERRRYADASGRLRIPLDRGHTLEGSYAMDGHGPVSIGLLAEVAAPGAGSPARVHLDSATTDASGKFHWEHLAPGTYLLEVVRAGPASPDTRTLLTRKVRVEETPASLALGDDLGEHAFSGALVYPEGGRLRRAVLTLRPRFDWHYVEFVAEMEGADDQRFYFEGLRSGEYDVEVEGYDRVRKRSCRLPPLRLTGTLVRDLSIAPE